MNEIADMADALRRCDERIRQSDRELAEARRELREYMLRVARATSAVQILTMSDETREHLLRVLRPLPTEEETG